MGLPSEVGGKAKYMCSWEPSGNNHPNKSLLVCIYKPEDLLLISGNHKLGLKLLRQLIWWHLNPISLGFKWHLSPISLDFKKSYFVARIYYLGMGDRPNLDSSFLKVTFR